MSYLDPVSVISRRRSSRIFDQTTVEKNAHIKFSEDCIVREVNYMEHLSAMTDQTAWICAQQQLHCIHQSFDMFARPKIACKTNDPLQIRVFYKCTLETVPEYGANNFVAFMVDPAAETDTEGNIAINALWTGGQWAANTTDALDTLWSQCLAWKYADTWGQIWLQAEEGKTVQGMKMVSAITTNPSSETKAKAKSGPPNPFLDWAKPRRHTRKKVLVPKIDDELTDMKDKTTKERRVPVAALPKPESPMLEAREVIDSDFKTRLELWEQAWDQKTRKPEGSIKENEDEDGDEWEDIELL